MLVEAWSRVRPDNWVLRIAGPDEGGAPRRVEKAVSAAGLSEVISFVGAIDGLAKQRALFDADLFVLPSHSESFGMAIVEALAHGLPVLTTTGAPWSMLPGRGCGWSVDPTVNGIAEGLRQATSCESKLLRAIGARGRELVASEFGWKGIANQFVATYKKLLTTKRRSENAIWSER